MLIRILKTSLGILLLAVIHSPPTLSANKVDVNAVAAAICYEATLPNDSSVGRPLPLAGHWNTGEFGNGFSPDYQLKMIESGHYLLPWFHLPLPNQAPMKFEYYRDALQKAAQLKLPISFISTQWERTLTDAPRYFYRAAKENPNVVDERGNVLKMVSPFGPLGAWYSAGKSWTDRDLIEKLQRLYPKPPLVLFISNNEHKKLAWPELEKSSRYHAAYPEGLDQEKQRQLVGDAWIKRYRTIQQGMRDGMQSNTWKEKAIFIGYDAFGSRAFGRWPEWIDYSLNIPDRFEPWPLAWDGASLSYYVYHWSTGTDFTVMSPQIESMNWIFMQAEALKLNSKFWFEMSTWDGYIPDKPNDKRKYYAALGQQYNPKRYEGYVQFGMWLLRPRVVREFRDHFSVLSKDEAYFLSVVNAVDRVYSHPILKKFWRKGRLLINEKHKHPYQVNIPMAYQDVYRWFLLDTNLDPKRPWVLNTQIPVFSLALVLNEEPDREWLIYAHAPLGDQHGVKIVVPHCTTIETDVTSQGAYFHVIEKNSVIHIVSIDI